MYRIGKEDALYLLERHKASGSSEEVLTLLKVAIDAGVIRAGADNPREWVDLNEVEYRRLASAQSI